MVVGLFALGPAAFYICWANIPRSSPMTQGRHFIALMFPVVTIIAVGLTAAIAKAIWVDRRHPEEQEQPHPERDSRRRRAF